jgi:hypothetical protein
VSPIIKTSDAPNCGVTYDRHSDDSRGIYNCNRFMIQPTGFHESNKGIFKTCLFVSRFWGLSNWDT